MKQVCKVGDGSVTIQCSGNITIDQGADGRTTSTKMTVSSGGSAMFVCSGSSLLVNGKPVEMPDGMTASKLVVHDQDILVDDKWKYDFDSSAFRKMTLIERAYESVREALS